MRDMAWDEFADAAGSVFTVRAGNAPLEFRLDRVEKLPPSGREAGSFRLEFIGPPEPVLPQAIYPFEDDGGTAEIFIVPIARDTAGIRYEAIFC